MPNIAIFIDAENIQPIYADQIFSYAGAAGTITVKEIYGAGIALNEWAAPILQHAIHTNVTLRPNRYKNSSDIALVIGAMDLLSRRERTSRGQGPTEGERSEDMPDTIFIASSDSDFSALAVRLRTAGMEVVGIGNVEKTNSAWRIACSKFISLTEDSQPQEPCQTEKAEEPAPGQEPARQQRREAPTHAARAENIRALILSILADNGGMMQTTPFFRLLNEDPDYRYDQRGSKRNPMDYLTQHYADILRLEKRPDGTLWFVSAAPVEGRKARKAPEPAAPQQEPQPQPQGISAALFTAAGVAEETAQQISALCAENHNLRSIYNRLRKLYGDTDGRKYYQIVKKHFRKPGNDS